MGFPGNMEIRYPCSFILEKKEKLHESKDTRNLTTVEIKVSPFAFKIDILLVSISTLWRWLAVLTACDCI